jgi:hypothetical protein
MGSGRSGTSMIAGMLAKADYFFGDNLYQARDPNPKGFFEDPEINDINENILSQVTLRRPPLIGNFILRSIPANGQRWLSRIPLNTIFTPDELIKQRISMATNKVPFCYKDPRFSYTLDVWRPFLQNVVYICVFRHPAVTAQSIIKLAKTDKHLKNFYISFHGALKVWTQIYLHILEKHIKEGTWLFVHYEQGLSKEINKKLENILDVKVDHSFPDRSLKRTKINRKIHNPKIFRIYNRLCQLANYRPEEI